MSGLGETAAFRTAAGVTVAGESHGEVTAIPSHGLSTGSVKFRSLNNSDIINDVMGKRKFSTSWSQRSRIGNSV